jgi:hypothetical protein
VIDPCVKVINLVLTWFSSDPSGHLLRVPLVTRQVSRLRFLQISYGEYLSTFFEKISNSVDPESQKTKE